MLLREQSRFAPTRRNLAGILVSGAVLLAPARPAVAADADIRLVALADELDDLDRRLLALCAAHRGMDVEDMPGSAGMEMRRSAVLDALASTEAASLKGCLAKARALRTEGVQHDADSFEAIVDSLTTDLLSLAA